MPILITPTTLKKMVIACGDDPYTHSLQISKPIFYYGLDDDNDIIAKNVEYTESGVIFDVFFEDNYYGHFDLPLYGKTYAFRCLSCYQFCAITKDLMPKKFLKY